MLLLRDQFTTTSALPLQNKTLSQRVPPEHKVQKIGPDKDPRLVTKERETQSLLLPNMRQLLQQ